MKEEKNALSFASHRQSGSVRGKSCIAYAFDLPRGTREEDRETEEFFHGLAEHYLSFLKKESENDCDFVRFAGLGFRKEENTLILLAAFCPFSEREFQKVATLIYDGEGNLHSIRKEKRSRRKPS